MTSWSRPAAVMMALLVFGTGGCSGSSPPPPVAQVEARPAKPHPRAIWVDGHWKWMGREKGYVWVPGHWRDPR